MIFFKKNFIILSLLFVLFSYNLFAKDKEENSSIPPQTLLGEEATAKVAKLKEAANKALDEKNYVLATELLIKVLDISPYDKEAILNYAIVNKSVGKYEQAMKAVDYLLNLEFLEDRDLVLILKGQIYMVQRMYRESLEQFRLAYKQNKGSHQAVFNMGNVYLELKLYRDSIASYNIAIERSPNDPAYYFNRGVAYDRQGKYREALADYTHVINLRPKTPYAFINAGIIFYNNEKYETALEYFDRAIELDVTYLESFYNRALVYNKLGELDKALDDLDIAIVIDPNNKEVKQLMTDIENQRFKIDVK